METYVLFAAGAVLVAIILLIVTLLSKSSNKNEIVEAVAPRAVPVDRAAAPVRGGARRRGAQQRLAAAAARREDDSEGEETLEEMAAQLGQSEGKVGAKKLRKLQDKAERKAQREAELEEREEKKQREARLEERRKQDDARRDAEEKALEAEADKRREEEEQREHEEYLKLKAAFTVDEEGMEETITEDDAESLLQKFINHIKEMKVVMLEDLASHFKLKTQDVIERIKSLQEEGRLTGVMDDRGKFIYITEEEYHAVARFIKQRGRVSITELAQSSNSLINMDSANSSMMLSEGVGLLTEAC